jgi:hypothetical protein
MHSLRIANHHPKVVKHSSRDNTVRMTICQPTRTQVA